MFKLKMESYIFPEYADCQKTLVGAGIARPCPFACEKTYPEKALLRQVGGRPMVAPTYSMRLPIRYKTVTYRCRTCNPVLRVL